MFVVTNRIPVSEGQEDAFEDRFRHKISGIEQSPGFVKNLILRPISRRYDAKTGAYRESEERGYYLVQSYWETEEAFWNWTASDSFRAAHSDRPPAEMFAGRNVLEIHQVILEKEA